jgi:homoserine dehydrogenase
MATALSHYQQPQRVPDLLCRVAIVGFGTVGTAVARLLQQGRHGELLLTHICNRNVARKKVSWLPRDVVWTDHIQSVVNSGADVIVELMGGLDAAYELVRAALHSGKSVVTANKQLIAGHGAELLDLAADNGVYLGFGACVAGGVPVITAMQNGLSGDRLVQVRGILNGTCNYILTRMDAGVGFADALREAQEAGFAEADPSYDVDGQDAAAKLAILARIGLRIAVAPEQIVCRSIRQVSAIDFAYARELRCTIRQISTARLAGGSAHVEVAPALVALESAFAKVAGSQNLVVSTGEFGGESSFGGLGAGGDPTAVAVISDVIEAARQRSSKSSATRYHPVSCCAVNADPEAPRYLRFVVNDRAGIIACIAGRVAKYDMNIDSVLQKPGHQRSALPFVITLEACRQSQLDAALEEIAGLDFLVEKPLVMPILG